MIYILKGRLEVGMMGLVGNELDVMVTTKSLTQKRR